jgi:hypothetical protein
MSDYYSLSQDIKAGQTFAYGRGGKHWTALADANTHDMQRRTENGKTVLYVAIPVSYRGVEQSAPLPVPLDKIIRLAN